ncbi:LacI family DNA-binding transcriptional regulator [Nonomuraea sp. NPDC005650]|uniref:LacI family DNA-binding transcriptional regulator n=1 Tax=Nonomuraea sp. NPDC005650 TaxID=3157045 RepID=UPI0033AF2DE3
MTRGPKIADVARLAEVSVPTVSRVLNGSSGVRPETVARVMRAVKELDYRPKGVARTLISGSRSMIAVMAAHLNRYGYAEVLAGIEQTARDNGYAVTVCVVESAGDDVEGAIRRALSQEVAGVIVIDFDAQGERVIGRMPSSVPMVGVTGFDGRPGHVPYAVMDEHAGGRLVTEHLLDLGHGTVHHVTEPPFGRPAGRTAGWRAALEGRGIEPPPTWTAAFDPRSGYEIGLELAHRDDVTAVFCATDVVAAAVLRALRDSGVPLPGGKSVAGFDDQPFSRFLSPALTTVEQDFQRLGRLAFRQLLHLRDGRSQPPDLVVRPRLVVRESAARPHH